MRKVSIEIAKAFINDKKKTVGNTYTENGEIFLHDNKIAWKWENNHPNLNSKNIHLCFSMCGWDTVTTRERLNTIFHHVFWDKENDLNQLGSNFVYLKQIKGKQYLFIWDRQMEIDPSKIYVLREIENDLFLDEPVALNNGRKIEVALQF